MLDQHLLQAGGRERKFTRGKVLQRPGDVVEHGYFVKQGCLRSYVLGSDGKEHVLQFAPENWIIGDLKGAVRKEPGTLFIDTLEDSVVMELDFTRVNDPRTLPAEILSVELTKRRNNIIALNDRIIDLLAANGEDRYLHFLETYPGLAQRLPQKLIASYLGLTPESLSRIRRSIAKGGTKAPLRP
jgi:CRP-like cAMP-binding protein